MRILFYGRLADTIGREIDLDAPDGSSIADLRARLASEHPAAASALTGGRSLTCVAGTLVRNDYRVGAGELIEFLPPVSGG